MCGGSKLRGGLLYRGAADGPVEEVRIPHAGYRGRPRAGTAAGQPQSLTQGSGNTQQEKEKKMKSVLCDTPFEPQSSLSLRHPSPFFWNKRGIP